MKKIEVGIFGMTGYMAGELMRILISHPKVEIKWVISRNKESIANSHPNFNNSRINIKLINKEEATRCDFVFFCTPIGICQSEASFFLKKGVKIIDLGADFRLNNRSDWERLYNKKHLSWYLNKEAIYGIPEINRKAIKNSRIVANPGCFSSAAILGLLPLFKSDLEEINADDVFITGISGTAGMGIEHSQITHHPEMANNILPYNMIDHRHTYEIEETILKDCNKEIKVHFSPVYVPVTRGICNIISISLDKKVDLEELREIYFNFYKDECFVNILKIQSNSKESCDYKPYPMVNSVSGTNFCNISLNYDSIRKRIVIVSVLDSIGKGGAQVAIQNMNIMADIPEYTSLESIGMHPY